ncbi:hypothetical protein CPT_Metamorpho_066 [Klebsiella phage Metamorpho]|nr:hypothetical protein CPT_Metamorpho_066 [Klebsiella phage Metamorpho]
METGKFYKLKREIRLTPGPLIKGVFDQIGLSPIKITRTFENMGVVGLVEFEIIRPAGERKRVEADEARFAGMWCIFTDYEFSMCFEEIAYEDSEPEFEDSGPEPEDGSHDWGVWTSINGNDTYKGGLTKDEAIAFAKSQRLNATDEVKVVIMQPFAIPVVHVNIRPF